MRVNQFALGFCLLFVLGCGAWQSIDQPSGSTLVRSSLVGTEWSTCINVGVNSTAKLYTFDGNGTTANILFQTHRVMEPQQVF